jgi:hypothetical protein
VKLFGNAVNVIKISSGKPEHLKTTSVEKENA